MEKYKGYQIKPHKEMPSLLIIVTDGKGGKIPAVMEGTFTSYKIAKHVIDTYNEKRGVVDGKEDNKSGD